LGFFCSDDARDAGEVVGDGNVGPVRSVKVRLNGGKRVIAEFEDEEAARF